MTTDVETFDFIVIGAGSAGCVVASRLSESGRHRVLLLEAGGEDTNFWIHVPMGYAKNFSNPRVNWMNQSEPEEELAGRALYVPHGKVLGGTSSINGMLYMRGHRADYDEWRQRGCVGWDWDSVLPYFKKSENQERGADAFHGADGPLRVSNQAVRFEIAERWIAAAMEAGLPANDDFNDGRQEGVGHFQSTTNRRRRWSSAAAFLRPARTRRNLKIATHAHATRILIENGAAVGVAYSQRGAPRVARAQGEVILCGGAFNSPQLLQLSGLGPAGLLQNLGIPVVRDIRAVGESLQDHFCMRLQFRVAQPITLNDFANSFWRRIAGGIQYVFSRTGPLSTNGNGAGAFVRSDPRLDRPDLQLTLHLWSFAARSSRGVLPHPFPGFSVNVAHVRPEARGSVRIKSSDPAVAPEIRFNFFKTPYDIHALVSGMRLVRKIAQQGAIASYIVGEVTPGPAIESEAELVDSVRQNGGSNMHPVGSCRMGSNDDDVVDSRLRVRGVGRLRVVDASIMPSIPAAGTNAPSIMIGEKGSDMILEDARATA